MTKKIVTLTYEPLSSLAWYITIAAVISGASTYVSALILYEPTLYYDQMISAAIVGGGAGFGISCLVRKARRWCMD